MASFRHQAGKLTPGTPGKQDNAFSVVLQVLGVEAGVLTAVEVGVGNEVAQVVVSLASGSQQGQMGAISEGDFSPSNGLEVQAPGCLGEVHGAAQVIMVGEGQGRIAQFSGPHQELLHRGSSLLKGIVAVTVQFGVAHTPALGVLPVPRAVHQIPKNSNMSAV